MTNIKATKRALGSSVLALFLCFAMLLGTTFAWFTDSVTSANNIITAGNLDVELEYKKVVDNVTDTNWTTVADGALFNDTTIWEPGHVEVVYLKVSNVGTLDLKYQLNINVADFRVGFNADGDEIDLRDHLVFKVVEIDETAVGTYTRENAVNADADEIGLKDYNGETTTLASKDVDYVALIVYMPETVGNEANYRGNADTAPMINLGVNLFATQVAAEEDSFGPDYDEDAPIVSPSVTLPTTPATKPIELNASAESADENVSVKLPTSVVDSLPDEVKEISLSVSKPVIEGNKITFDSIEIVDQDGEIVELSELNLTDKITVTLPEQTMFAPNEVVEIYHDGEFITIATVDANGAISYDVAHLCEVTVGEFDKPEETYDSVTIKTLAQLLHFVKGEYGTKTGILAEDITVIESLVIPEDVTLKIDLNGKTITGAINKGKGAIIVNEGNLSIANGTVANTAENGDAVIENKGTMILGDVTVNGAPMTPESYPEYAIISTGNLVVEDGTVVVSDRGTLRIKGGKTVINGGKFVATDAAGDRVITMHTIYANGGTLTIYDGIFQNNYKGASGSSVICPAGSTIDIYGGSFTDGNADESNFNNTANIQNYMGYGKPVNVYGGTYDDATVKKNVAKGKEALKSNGLYYVVDEKYDYAVSTVEELKAAIAEGGKIVLVDNITLDADNTITVIKGKEVTLDLNGYTISGTSDQTGKNVNIFDVRGTMTVSGGTITVEHTGTNMGWNNSTNVFNVTDGGVLNISNATIENLGGSDMAFVAHLNNWGEVTLNITNSTIKSTYCAVRVFNSGHDMNNVTIKGSTIYTAGNRAFWVHNYSGDDSLLNFNIFGNGNKYVAETDKIGGPIRYGFDNPVYFNADGYRVVSNADELVEALENGKDVLFANDIKIDPANMSNAYGTTGINIMNGQTIDGNGYTLDIKGAGGTWDSGINTTGGVIKNIKVTGSFRGIFINHNSKHSEPVVLENVIIEGTTYTISCDQGLNQTLIATNCTFNGWTSYAKTLGEATFVNCKFGEGNGYNYSRPYAPTEYVGCAFAEGHTLDPRAAVTFENCTIGGEALTADNLADLVTNTANGAKVYLNGALLVSDTTELQAAINSGESNILLGKGEYTADLYVVTANRKLTITGQGADTKLNFAKGQVRLELFDSLTINKCTIGRMVDKSWGQLVFGSSTVAGGEYTLSNCIFNGESTQGIYINQNVEATFNIENCTFNGDFGREGAITIQDNDVAGLTVNVIDCTFTNIPENSHKIAVLQTSTNAWTLNANNVSVWYRDAQ